MLHNLPCPFAISDLDFCELFSSSSSGGLGGGQLNQKFEKLSKFSSFSFSDTALNKATDTYHEDR